MTTAPPGKPRSHPRGRLGRRLLSALASIRWILLSLAVSAALVGGASVGAFSGADLLLGNYLYRSQAPRAVPPITIVRIDDASLTTIGPYPWRRSAYIQLFGALHHPDRLPAVVAFDVGFFDVTDEDPAPFGQTMADFPRPVVLAAKADNIQSAPPSQTPLAEGFQAAQQGLLSENTTPAFANVILDGDQRVRRVDAAVRTVDGALVPSIAVAVVRAFLGVDDAREPLIIQDGRAVLTSAVHRKLELGTTYPAIAAPLDRDGAFYVNYIGGDPPFPSVSFADVLNGTADPALLKDRILLVGATAVDLHDIVSRPGVGADQVPGVEVHAQAVATLLQRDFLLPPDPRLNALLTVFFGLLSAQAAWRVRTARSFVVFLALLASQPVVAAAAFSLPALGDRDGRIVSIFYPSLAIVGSYLSVILLRIATEEREKRFLRRAFSQYVSPELVDEIAANPRLLKLGGDRRELTVLFSDIRGFTTISERMEAEDLVALLNSYFDIQTELVLAQRGVIDKFIGDAMMAFWGAPMAQPRQAELACAAALRMVDTIAPFNAEIAARGLPPIAMGVGINTGPAVVGNMGSSKRFDYTAMGDTVNLASRLESLTKVYGVSVLVSQATRDAAGPGFVFRTVDKVRVKGKKHAVTIYELVAVQKEGAATPAWIARFEAGLALAWARDWDGADAAFRDVLAAHPDDGPAGVFLDRTAEGRQAPPPPNWDGSHTFDHK